MKRIGSFLSILVMTIAGFAQIDTSKIYELSLEDLLKMEVITSSKFAQKQSLAPNVISLINSSEIKDFGWNSINEVMYKQSGFFPSQDFERSTIGSRGLPEGWNNNHLLLMMDGIPFNMYLYGTAITNEFTPLIFSKSIEIIKGPGSALYGSNATNGVVTLNTISANDYKKNKLITSVNYGEKNTMFYDVLATFKTKPFAITSSISYNKTDGEQYQSADNSLEIDPQTNLLKTFEPQYDRSGGYFFLKLEGNDKIKGFSMQMHSQITEMKTGHGWLWNIPDKEEKLQDTYHSFILKYQSSLSQSIDAEIVAKYTQHNIDWDLWYFRTNAYYPNGVNEYLNTSVGNVFTRFQLIFKLKKNSVLVVATEPNFFLYSGDKAHYANTDILNATDGYPPFATDMPLDPYLEMIKDKTVSNIGNFVQFSSGNLLGSKLQTTISLRYDTEFFKYIDLNSANNDVKAKNFEEFSPRISIVYSPIEDLSFKLLGVTAFRAPAPTELFGYNTWALASNINELKSERIKSAEFAVDYNMNSYLNIRANMFYTIAEGQIGYSLGNNNLSTNLYDLTNIGTELELLFKKNKLSGFTNASYVHRIDEKIYANELAFVSEHTDKLTWAPAITANAGLIYQVNSFKFSVQGHFQDKVFRRDKDFYTAAELQSLGYTQQPRTAEIAAWFAADATISYKYKFIEFMLKGKNIFNSDNYLVKSMKFPFDYKMEGRRISVGINFEL